MSKYFDFDFNQDGYTFFQISDKINSMDHMLFSEKPKVLSKQFETKWNRNAYVPKRNESAKVNRRAWLHVPSGILWSTCSDIQNVVEI